MVYKYDLFVNIPLAMSTTINEFLHKLHLTQTWGSNIY